MWTYNNICMNMNFIYKGPKGGHSASYERLQGADFQRVMESRGGIKSKQKLEHAACI